MDKYSSRRVVRETVNLGSDYATQIYRGFVDSFLNPPAATLDQWRLVKLEMLENGYFEEELEERRAEFSRQGLAQEEMSTHYGFLAAASEELVDLTLREGLKVRFCPINSLGYCIAGVHLCVHGDVCLQEAALETGDDGEQIVLVAFKFMFGRTRRVAPVTPKDMSIVAPSPGFNCHIAEDRPGRTDSVSEQYLRSLAYLYEFENSFYHPVPRPRQCSPLAAMYFRRRRGSGCPPKPPQFLPVSNPTAGRFPSAAVTSSSSASVSAVQYRPPPPMPTMPPPMLPPSLVTSSTSSLIQLAPDVASAVGSVLSELRQASSMAATVGMRQKQQQQQQQSQQPPPPRLDGIRGFLKNATGSTAKVQPLMSQQTSPPQKPPPPPQQQQPPLVAEQPRRNAFLTAAAPSSSSAPGPAFAGSIGAVNRFHPYTRIQTASGSATSTNNTNSSSNSSIGTSNRKPAFGSGGRR